MTGTPFTADDCVFNWAYARDPATAATSIALYHGRRGREGRRPHGQGAVQAGDAVLGQCVRGQLRMPDPQASVRRLHWRQVARRADQFGAGRDGRRTSSSAFSPGDLVVGTINTDYYEPNKPFFDEIQMKGGGDAASAARAVLQTGEFDYAWNLQVEDDVLSRMEKGGQGASTRRKRPGSSSSTSTSPIRTSRWTGERSSAQDQASDPERPGGARGAELPARARLRCRNTSTAAAAWRRANFVNVPKRYDSPNMHYEFSVEKATAAARHGGRLEARRGRRSRQRRQAAQIRLQTSINQPRQKTQAIFKQACQKAGIALELKTVVASVYFSSDVANPDTYSKFYTDLEDVQTRRPTRRTRRSGCAVSIPRRRRRRRTSGRGGTSAAGRARNTTTTWDKQQYELDPIKRAAVADRVQRSGLQEPRRAADRVSADRGWHPQQPPRPSRADSRARSARCRIGIGGLSRRVGRLPAAADR